VFEVSVLVGSPVQIRQLSILNIARDRHGSIDPTLERLALRAPTAALPGGTESADPAACHQDSMLTLS
jgi:hypothetical protein